MKKTFIYSLVVATLLVGCGDKESGSIAESVKSAASGAVEKTKDVAKEAGHSAVDAVKEGGSAVEAAKDAVSDATSKTVEAAKEAASSAVNDAKEAGSAVVEKASEVVASTATAATAAVASATEATKEVASEVAEKVTSAGDSEAGKAAFAKCVACHGPNAEKKALGASQVIAGWDTAKTEAAMKGYKDGSYGGAMKGVMKGQVVSMSDADIANVAAYISTLNK